MGFLIQVVILASLLVFMDGCAENNQGVNKYIKPHYDAASHSPCHGPLVQLEQERLQSRAQYVAAAAVSAPGTEVCRKIPVGLAESDYSRGIVLREQGGQVSVKIINPGQFKQGLNGEPIVQGMIVHDAVTDWVPCTE
ncbi:MAG: hypothetical protein ACYCSS_08525 [Sulfuriferula sp.]